MWKRGKKADGSKKRISTGLWKRLGAFPREKEKKKFSTPPANFSTGNVEKRRLIAGVDIGCDRLDGFGKGGALVHLFFNLFDGVHNGGVVASV